MKRILSIALSTLMLLAMITVAGAEGEVVELILWDHWTQEYLQPYVDEFNETVGAENGIHVTWEYVEDENNTTTTRLMASNLAGTSPDMVSIAQMDLLSMASNDLLAVPPQDVQDYIAENYFEANVGLSTYEGVIWGYPTESQCYSLMVNMDLLNEAGITEIPKTWDELKAAAEACTKIDENGEKTQCGIVFPFTFNESMHTNLISHFWGEGEDLYPTTDSTNLGDETGTKILEYFLELAPFSNANWQSWSECYANGFSAMVFADPWYLTSTVLPTNEDVYNATRVSTVPTSSGEKGTSMLRGFNLCVPAASAHQDEAWLFLNWLNQADENGVSRLQEVEAVVKQFLPSMKTYDMPSKYLEEVDAAYREILEGAKPQPPLTVYSEVQDCIDNMLDEILINGTDIEEARAQAIEEIEAIFDEL